MTPSHAGAAIGRAGEDQQHHSSPPAPNGSVTWCVKSVACFDYLSPRLPRLRVRSCSQLARWAGRHLDAPPTLGRTLYTTGGGGGLPTPQKYTRDDGTATGSSLIPPFPPRPGRNTSHSLPAPAPAPRLPLASRLPTAKLTASGETLPGPHLRKPTRELSTLPLCYRFTAEIARHPTSQDTAQHRQRHRSDAPTVTGVPMSEESTSRIWGDRTGERENTNLGWDKGTSNLIQRVYSSTLRIHRVRAPPNHRPTRHSSGASDGSSARPTVPPQRDRPPGRYSATQTTRPGGPLTPKTPCSSFSSLRRAPEGMHPSRSALPR